MRRVERSGALASIFMAGASTFFLAPAASGQTAEPSSAQLADLIRKQNVEIQKLRDEVNKLSSEVRRPPDSAPIRGYPEEPARSAQQPTSLGAVTETETRKAEPEQGAVRSLKVGKANFSLTGSWMEGVMAYRRHNEFSSASGSSQNTPFPFQGSYGLREFRADVRGTRFNLGVFSDPFRDNEQLKGRLQFDFANAANGTTQNNNNWSPRLRQAWAEYDLNRSGWHWIAGQAYSLTTPGGNLQAADGGPSADLGWSMRPGTENVFQQVDAFLPGYIGTRQAQFRVVKDLAPTAAVGLSIESPEASWGGTTRGLTNGALSGATSGAGSSASALAGNGSLAALSANGYVNTSGLSTWPNVILKGSYQAPSDVLVEAYGIVRSFKNVPGISGAPGTGSVISGGGGVSTYLKLLPRTLDGSLSVNYGSLGGIDSSGAIPDVTTDSDGKPVAVKELAAWFGLYAYPTRDLTVLFYGGYARANAAGVSGTNFGYGNPRSLNSGCYVLNGTCAGSTERAVSGQLAAVWRLYNGPEGRLELQPQLTYVQNRRFRDVAGVSASASNWIFNLAVRYFPF